MFSHVCAHGVACNCVCGCRFHRVVACAYICRSVCVCLSVCSCISLSSCVFVCAFDHACAVCVYRCACVRAVLPSRARVRIFACRRVQSWRRARVHACTHVQLCGAVCETTSLCPCACVPAWGSWELATIYVRAIAYAPACGFAITCACFAFCVVGDWHPHRFKCVCA